VGEKLHAWHVDPPGRRLRLLAAGSSLGRAEQFALGGYLPRVRVLGAAAATQVSLQFDALEGAEGAAACGTGLVDRHFDQRFVWEVAAHPAVLDAVEAAIGPNVMLLTTHFFCKYPQPLQEQAPERFVAWHQDVTYWGLEPPEAMTAWYAVDDSDAENGCMRVIPGTHMGGIRAHGTSGRAGNMLSINQEVPVTVEEEARAVNLPLRAGEISLHHGMLIHGSNPNRSGRRRCGLTIRYVKPEVRQVAINSQGRRYAPVLLRGEDRYGHFPAASLPQY
jgi:non-haem Fe2+, alpha-ketoglutarate-dependent halogenase